MSTASLYEVWPIAARDFASAGEVSGAIKRMLKRLGIDAALIRRISVAAYEVELNIVIHSLGGEIELSIIPEAIHIEARDHGPGIADIDLAMREGYSTASDDVRNMGFGAGMGLPNMQRNADGFVIRSSPEGTVVTMDFSL